LIIPRIGQGRTGSFVDEFRQALITRRYVDHSAPARWVGHLLGGGQGLRGKVPEPGCVASCHAEPPYPRRTPMSDVRSANASMREGLACEV
jgi:hypothetical protein